MLDFRRYRNFVRILFKINLGLSVLFFISHFYSYTLLVCNPHMKYYIQTNTGFIYPIEPVNPRAPHQEVIVTHFE
jgi:hypothetical protein